jgi:hypothetical protein
MNINKVDELLQDLVNSGFSKSEAACLVAIITNIEEEISNKTVNLNAFKQELNINQSKLRFFTWFVIVLALCQMIVIILLIQLLQFR